MAKRKLEIIELNLGIDPDEVLRPIPIEPDTKQRITETVKLAKLEQDAINKLKAKKKDKEQKQLDVITRCYRILHNSAKKNATVPAQRLLEISQTDNLSGLMTRIRNYIKKRGAHYKIKKRKVKGQTHYTLTPL